MSSKKKILILGLGNTVLRLFIKSLMNEFDIFFISSNTLQFDKIESMLNGKIYLGKNKSLASIFKRIFYVITLNSRHTFDYFVAFHNSSIMNGISILILKKLFPKVEIIYFPYDIKLYKYIKEVKFREKSWIFWFFDRICYEKCDKIITKGFENELVYLKGIYCIRDKPHFVFKNLIEKNDLVQKKSTYNNSIINLVYIGGIQKNDYSMNNYCVFDLLSKNKNIILNIYSNDAVLIRNLKDRANIRIHDYCSDHNSLIKEISKYDFGISIYKPSKYDFLQCKMASGIKIFDYLSAGLPIIVDSEHESIAKFIISNDFGFQLSFDEIENIHKYCRKIDYEKFIKSVESGRKKFILENNIDPLIRFIEEEKMSE